MKLLLPDRALLLKLLYENGDNAAEVLLFYRGQKSLSKSLVTSCALERIFKYFEKTVLLNFKQVEVRKKEYYNRCRLARRL